MIGDKQSHELYACGKGPRRVDIVPIIHLESGFSFFVDSFLFSFFFFRCTSTILWWITIVILDRPLQGQPQITQTWKLNSYWIMLCPHSVNSTTRSSILRPTSKSDFSEHLPRKQRRVQTISHHLIGWTYGNRNNSHSRPLKHVPLALPKN